MYRKLINPIADMSMLAHIETIRLTGGETANIRDASPFPKNYGQSLFTTDVLYQKAFRNDGIDLGAEDPQAVAGQIKARAIVRELVVALDHWRRPPATPPGPSGWSRSQISSTASPGQRAAGSPRICHVRQEHTFGIRPNASRRRSGNLDPVPAGDGPPQLRRSRGSFAPLGAAQRARPQDFWINLELGKTILLRQKAEPRDALPFFEAALATSGGNPDVYVYIGNTYVRLNKLSYAEDTYRKAISLRLDLFVAQANLGCVLTSLGKLREGQAALTKAANLDPSSELAFFDLGFVRQLQDNHPGAAKAYARALELRPDYVEARTIWETP